ncbi:MAG: hypothetical protein WDL87_09375 [Candidatus Omnitrophota bacterium]|jgi:hypothetical protein
MNRTNLVFGAGVILLVFLFKVFITEWMYLNKVNPYYCRRLDREIENELKKANYCDQDSDCMYADLGARDYAIVCGRLINKSANLKKTQLKVAKSLIDCTPLVACDWVPSPKLSCISRKCQDSGYYK